MIDTVPDPAEERWWSDLEPTSKIARPQLVAQFARESRARVPTDRNGSRIDLKALRIQINGFADDLKNAEWSRRMSVVFYGARIFTADGRGQMDAPTKLIKEELSTALTEEEMRGWSNVLDVYAHICDPLARYVVSFYPRLREMRPHNLPVYVMGALKSKAQSGACNALREGMVWGFGGVIDPLFSSEGRAAEFLARLAAGDPLDTGLHQRDAILAYSNLLVGYANQITAPDESLAGADELTKVLANEPSLSEDSVREFATIIAARAEELRIPFAGQVPSIEESRVIVDGLLRRVVDDHVGSIGRQIVAIESATRTNDELTHNNTLAKLKAQSEHASQSRESTRAALVDLVSRGHLKTEADVERMFAGRQGGNIRRERYAKGKTQSNGPSRPRRGRPEDDGKTTVPGIETIAAPEPPPSLAAALARLTSAIVEFRDDIPGGLGHVRSGRNTDEFDVTLEILDRGLTDRDAIRRYCDEQWPTRQSTAVAKDAPLFFKLVMSIIKFGLEG